MHNICGLGDGGEYYYKCYLQILYVNENNSLFTISVHLRAGPGVYSASSRKEYEKHKNNNVSGE
jgi:hypothetical protein